MDPSSTARRARNVTDRVVTAIATTSTAEAMQAAPTAAPATARAGAASRRPLTLVEQAAAPKAMYPALAVPESTPSPLGVVSSSGPSSSTPALMPAISTTTPSPRELPTPLASPPVGHDRAAGAASSVSYGHEVSDDLELPIIADYRHREVLRLIQAFPWQQPPRQSKALPSEPSRRGDGGDAATAAGAGTEKDRPAAGSRRSRGSQQPSAQATTPTARAPSVTELFSRKQVAEFIVKYIFRRSVWRALRQLWHDGALCTR